MTANGHEQRSAVEWSGIIAQYRQSGLGMKEFCTQAGLTLRTFEEWYRRQRRSETSKGQFVEVKAPSAAVSPWAVEVELPNGVRLRVRGYGMWFTPEVRRILAYSKPVDLRKSIDGLVRLVKSVLEEDPLSGSLFGFVNRRGHDVFALLSRFTFRPLVSPSAYPPDYREALASDSILSCSPCGWHLLPRDDPRGRATAGFLRS